MLLTQLQIAALIEGDNFILAVDSYKYGQWQHVRAGTKKTHVSIVPRKPYEDKEHGIYLDKVVVMGPQVVAAILASVVITDEMIDEAEIEITEQGYTFNRAGWEHIRDLGYLPLNVRALPEGTVVPVGLPIATVENTDGDTDNPSAWLPAYIETWSQDIIWKMTTVASKLRLLRQWVDGFNDTTGIDYENGEYMVHNFGDRGSGGGAIRAAISHSVFFSGSDSGRSNRFIKRIYNTTLPILTSIDAAEHSTMCSNSDCDAKDDSGAFEMSLEMLKRAVKRAENGVGIPVMACPIDTFDDERFIRDFVIPNYKKICDIGGKYVARPDSGIAVERPIDVVNWFRSDLRGQGVYGTINVDNFWTGPENLGCIQGDGLKLWDFPVLFANAIKAGLSAANFSFGFGGGMTNGSGRDDFSFSMKATARMDAEGNWIAMQKQPKTDPGKNSLKGRVTVVSDGYNLVSAPRDGKQVEAVVTIFENGGLPFTQSFDQVRELARH